MSGFNGAQDYLFDYNYVGRNDINGVPAAQFTEMMVHLKFGHL